MTDDDVVAIHQAYIELKQEVAGLRDQLGRALARAVTAEMQLAYWIGEADKHGHGPSADEVPFAEEVGDD